MEKAIYLSLLLDYYGELLTDKQREYAELYYNENLSLREIAENDGISRQAVRDALLRAEATLRDTEEKTGLYRRHTELLGQIAEAKETVQEIAGLNAAQYQDAKLLSLCAELESKLEQMKL